MSILSCFHWKYVQSDDEVRPDTLSAFSCAHCLLLEKLPHDAKWCDVEQAVCSKDTSHGPDLSVRGRWQRNRYPKILSKDVVLTIVAASEAIRDAKVDLLRKRVVPWELFSCRVIDMMNSGISIPVVQQTLGCTGGQKTKEVETEGSTVETLVEPLPLSTILGMAKRSLRMESTRYRISGRCRRTD